MTAAPRRPGDEAPGIHRVLAQLDGVVVRSNGWMALCPAHPDENPSLSVNQGDDHRVLLHCHAGCTVDAITEALGLRMADLMPPRSQDVAKTRTTTSAQTYPSIDAAAKALAKAAKGTVAAVHDYPTASGASVFAVVRIATKSGKTFRPIHEVGGRWRIGDPTGPLPLYNLQVVADAKEVVVVEGELCATTCAQLGIVATTSAHGAKSSAKTDWSPLAGKAVILMPDNDAAGRHYADEVAQTLRALDPPARVRVLLLPALPDGGDIVDWWKSRSDAGLEQAEVAEELARLIDQAEDMPSSVSSVSSAGSVRRAQCHDWQLPLPIVDQVVLARFPIDAAFPSYLTKLHDLVLAIAECHQVPVDAAAMLLLPILALPLSKRFEVEPLPGWREQLSVYVVVLLPSGDRKTAILRCLLNPVYSWQRDKATGLAAVVAEFENNVFSVSEKLKTARQQRAKGKPSLDDPNNLARQLHELERARPHAPRLIATEGTSEAIAKMLVDNGERGLLAAAEGDALDVMLGRYSGSPNFGVWLSGHSGDSVDSIRRGRAADHLVHPALQVALCIQPEAALDLIGSSAAEGRGLLGRMFFSVPESRVGYRKLLTPPIPTELVDLYGARIQAHLNRQIPPDPEILRLDPEATELLTPFREANEADLRPDGALSLARSWGSKLPGAVVRIAGIFSAFADRKSIDAETMNCALQFAPYLTSHYEHIASVAGDDPRLQIARRIDQWIRRTSVTTFSRRDAFSAVRSVRINKVEAIDPALELLEQRNRIRRVADAKEGRSGRPGSPTYEANPALGSARTTSPAQNPQNSQNPPDGGAE